MVTDQSFELVTDLERSSFQGQDLFLSAGAKADGKCRELTLREATGTTNLPSFKDLHKFYWNLFQLNHRVDLDLHISGVLLYKIGFPHILTINCDITNHVIAMSGSWSEQSWSLVFHH